MASPARVLSLVLFFHLLIMTILFLSLSLIFLSSPSPFCVSAPGPRNLCSSLVSLIHAILLLHRYPQVSSHPNPDILSTQCLAFSCKAIFLFFYYLIFSPYFRPMLLAIPFLIIGVLTGGALSKEHYPLENIFVNAQRTSEYLSCSNFIPNPL